ncbi:MAG: hypothetical protein GEV04_22140 [Actinophytocola sp.]|nr:hypothetical protein [Actinophytocola sp.]
MDNGEVPARTVLERRIRERRLTFEEFVEFAETFARQHNEPGTLSVRHLQRLAAGRGEHGRPIGRPRAATARLLERIFGVSIDELLSPPDAASRVETDSAAELRRMRRASQHVDTSVLALLRDQLTATRRLDRQFGAIVAHDEVLAKITQVTRLLEHSLSATTREQLAAHLSELHALAGWQALDTADLNSAWHHYSTAATAAAQSDDPAFSAHSTAGQAFVLIDLGSTDEAANLLGAVRDKTQRGTGRRMRSWLAAAHGEALAADQRRADSLRAFDQARSLLPDGHVTDDGPYVVLDETHLGRWRGHALARLGEPSAVDVLASALDRLDGTFARAEASLRVDLATAYATLGEPTEAHQEISRAKALAGGIGSARQQRRLQALAGAQGA